METNQIEGTKEGNSVYDGFDAARATVGGDSVSARELLPRLEEFQAGS